MVGKREETQKQPPTKFSQQHRIGKQANINRNNNGRKQNKHWRKNRGRYVNEPGIVMASSGNIARHVNAELRRYVHLTPPKKQQRAATEGILSPFRNQVKKSSDARTRPQAWRPFGESARTTAGSGESKSGGCGQKKLGNSIGDVCQSHHSEKDRGRTASSTPNYYLTNDRLDAKGYVTVAKGSRHEHLKQLTLRELARDWPNLKASERRAVRTTQTVRDMAWPEETREGREEIRRKLPTLTKVGRCIHFPYAFSATSGRPFSEYYDLLDHDTKAARDNILERQRALGPRAIRLGKHREDYDPVAGCLRYESELVEEELGPSESVDDNDFHQEVPEHSAGIRPHMRGARPHQKSWEVDLGVSSSSRESPCARVVSEESKATPTRNQSGATPKIGDGGIKHETEQQSQSEERIGGELDAKSSLDAIASFGQAKVTSRDEGHLSNKKTSKAAQALSEAEASSLKLSSEIRKDKGQRDKLSARKLNSNERRNGRNTEDEVAMHCSERLVTASSHASRKFDDLKDPTPTSTWSDTTSDSSDENSTLSGSKTSTDDGSNNSGRGHGDRHIPKSTAKSKKDEVKEIARERSNIPEEKINRDPVTPRAAAAERNVTDKAKQKKSSKSAEKHRNYIAATGTTISSAQVAATETSASTKTKRRKHHHDKKEIEDSSEANREPPKNPAFEKESDRGPKRIKTAREGHERQLPREHANESTAQDQRGTSHFATNIEMSREGKNKNKNKKSVEMRDNGTGINEVSTSAGVSHAVSRKRAPEDREGTGTQQAQGSRKPSKSHRGARERGLPSWTPSEPKADRSPTATEGSEPTTTTTRGAPASPRSDESLRAEIERQLRELNYVGARLKEPVKCVLRKV